MKIEVPITRKVELHVHNYNLVIRYNTDGSALSYSVGCVCGNGMSIRPTRQIVATTWVEDRLSLDKVLEIAADEQERKHKDWTY